MSDYQEGWSDEEPTMSEADGVRYLHFGTEWIQGAMRTRKPTELVLAYTQQMMAWLIFVEPTKHQSVGILGLGAGSLLRFTLKHTPANVETAEWNPAVTAMCRAFFRLPSNDRSYIDHVDAAVWLEKPHNIGRYVALMVDLYDAEARGPVRDSLEFYQGCQRALSPDGGVMTVNLFGNHESFPRNLENIRAAFEGPVVELPEIDAGNRVVLAFRGPVLDIRSGEFLERAARLERACGLPATRWARHILEQLQSGA